MSATKLPDWVVERVADVLIDALTANRMNERDLSSEEIAQETLAEFLAILEERGLRVVPPNVTDAMIIAAKRTWGMEASWMSMLAAAPPLAALLDEKD